MMNSPFVMQTAETLADRVLATHASEDERLRELALLAYSRPASADELRENRAFLSQIDQGLATEVPDPVARQRRAWGILGQVVLASSEFIYVR